MANFEPNPIELSVAALDAISSFDDAYQTISAALGVEIDLNPTHNMPIGRFALEHVSSDSLFAFGRALLGPQLLVRTLDKTDRRAKLQYAWRVDSVLSAAEPLPIIQNVYYSVYNSARDPEATLLAGASELFIAYRTMVSVLNVKNSFLKNPEEYRLVG